MYIKSTKAGFTIVELLIVIVVIAVLASISVVAYNGIQQRSRNAKELAAVKMYLKALHAYALDNGAYPDANNSGCLGEGYTNGCWPSSNNTNFNNQLRPYLNNLNPLPSGNTAPISYFGTRSGIAYYYTSSGTLDGQPNPWLVVYFLEGMERCTVGPGAGRQTGSGTSWVNLTSTPNASGQSESNGVNTMCVVALPDPLKV